MRRTLSWSFPLLLPCVAACASSTPTETAPPSATVAAAPEPEPEPEPTDFSIGTFRLKWAFDAADDRGKIANANNAATTEDWEWMVERVATVLREQDLDIVALQGVGGEREVRDIVMYMSQNGGPDYDWAFVEGTDKKTRQQVAVISKFRISDMDRLDMAVAKHLAVDIELPSGDHVGIITAQLRSGGYPANAKARRAQALEIKKAHKKLRGEMPYLILGDLGSAEVPDTPDYKGSAPYILAGEHTRKSAADDCLDSAGWHEAQETTADGKSRDRIFFCGIEPDRDSLDVVGRDSITIGDPDESKTPWSSIAADERDLSDHYIVRARIPFEQPKSESEEASGESMMGSD